MKDPLRSIPLYKGEISYVPDRKEVIELSSADPCFYNHYFFGRHAFRQEDAPFERRFWACVEDPDNRYVNLQMFRGSAKTTRIRTYLTKRIAFGISRTILYIGKSDDHATRSVMWLRKNIQFNTRWTECFGLIKGDKFSQGTLELVHGIEEDHTIYITAAGITGSIRGINFDDYRPDLIVLDDIIDKESVHTAAARKKVTELVHGDIKESLEAETDNPNAKMIMLATPLNADDPGEEAKRDPEWTTFRFSCWTPETEGLPVDQQESSWPARYPTELLRRQKRNALETNKLWIFTREKECKLISADLASFKEEWLQYYDIAPPREQMRVCMWIDPVPPPSDAQIAQGLAKKDFEAFAVVGKWEDKFYVLETKLNRGHEPDWTIATFFELIWRWKPQLVGVEATAYQRTLAWLLKKAMQQRRHYVTIHEDDDKRKKLDKITDGLHPVASNKALYVQKSQTELIEQFIQHPDVEHDDILESVARCCEQLNMGDVFGTYEDLLDEEKDIPALEQMGGCP